MRKFCAYIVIVALVLSAGCGGGVSPVSGRKPEAPHAAPAASVTVPLPETAGVALGTFAAARVALHDNQRDAVEVPAGTTRIDFDAIAAASRLRFSLLAAEGAAVSATVYQDGVATPISQAVDAGAWAQRGVALGGGGVASLVLACEMPFHLAACAVVPVAPAKPDVFIFLIDTLRQDHLSAYRYPLETTPGIKAFAEEATVFRDLTPMSSWTRPSVTSLLTGTLDYTHHVLGAEDRVRAGLPSLARTLAEAGWETCSLVNNPAVGSSFGTGADFQWHTDLWQDRQPVGWAGDVVAVDRALEAIGSADGQPLFLYIHTMAPHRDYTPHPDYVDRFMPEKFVGTVHQVRIQKDLANYDAEIRFSDDQFSRVVQGLKEAGRYENALIVVLSDHGEQFMEHGSMAHSQSLHFGELTVPFLVKLPGNRRAANVVRTPVQMADVAPTILDVLGLSAPVAMEGRSLLPLMVPGGPFAPQPTFARLRFGPRHFYMAQTETLKYLHDVVLGESTWYDRDKDPDEQFPLRTPPEGGAELKAFADAVAARPVPAEGEMSPPLTPDETENLKTLGYL